MLLGLGLLALVEIGLRAAGYRHEVASVTFRFVGPDVLNMPGYVRDRRLFWRLRAGAPDIGSEGRPWYTSESGFRGPAVVKERRPGTLRVVCMGDSSTYGVGIPLEQTYVSILGRSLEYQLKQPVEMVNAGCPGYSSYQGLKLLESDVLPLRPDVVTLFFGAWNDFTPAIGGDDEAKGARGRLPAWTDRALVAAEHSRLYMLLAHGYELLAGNTTDARFGLRSLDEYLKGFAAGRPPEGERVPPDKFAANLRRMIRLARERGTLPVLVSPPLSQESQREHPVFSLYRDAVHDVGATEKVLLVPASEDLAAREKDREDIFLDPIHPNVHGHEIIAALATQRLVPALRPAEATASHAP